MAQIHLTTGYVVEFEERPRGDQVKEYEHLLQAIIGERMAAAQRKLKTTRAKKQKATDGWRTIFKAITKEIDFIVDHQIEDHANFLRGVLFIDCYRALQSLQNKVDVEKQGRVKRRKKPIQ